MEKEALVAKRKLVSTVSLPIFWIPSQSPVKLSGTKLQPSRLQGGCDPLRDNWMVALYNQFVVGFAKSLASISAICLGPAYVSELISDVVAVVV